MLFQISWHFRITNPATLNIKDFIGHHQFHMHSHTHACTHSHIYTQPRSLSQPVYPDPFQMGQIESFDYPEEFKYCHLVSPYLPHLRIPYSVAGFQMSHVASWVSTHSCAATWHESCPQHLNNAPCLSWVTALFYCNKFHPICSCLSLPVLDNLPLLPNIMWLQPNHICSSFSGSWTGCKIIEEESKTERMKVVLEGP